MSPADFQREITRLRNHYGERHYSNELVAILWQEFAAMSLGDFRAVVMEAIATRGQSRAPLRDEFREMADKLSIRTKSSWSYFEVDDCMVCGGVGWHYVTRPYRNGGEGIVACDDCRAGKNMQIGPKGTITSTLLQNPGSTYLRPGRERRS